MQEQIFSHFLKILGGPGSGNFGHAGRPGEVGGSQPRGGVMSAGRQKIAKLAKGVRFEIRGFAEKIGLDLDNPSNNANPKYQKYAEKYQKWRRSLEKVYLGDEVRKKSFDRMRVRGFNLRKEAAKMAGEPGQPKQAGAPGPEVVHPNMDPAEFYKARPDMVNPLVGFKEQERKDVGGGHVDKVYKLTGVDGDGKPCVAFFKPDSGSRAGKEMRRNILNHKDKGSHPSSSARELAAYELAKTMGIKPNMVAVWKDSNGEVGCLVEKVLEEDTGSGDYADAEGSLAYKGPMTKLADQAMMNIITGNTDGHVHNGRRTADHSEYRQIDFGLAFPNTADVHGNGSEMAWCLRRLYDHNRYLRLDDDPTFKSRVAEIPAIRARMTEQARKVKDVDWSSYEKSFRFTREIISGIKGRADAVLALDQVPDSEWAAKYEKTLFDLSL